MTTQEPKTTPPAQAPSEHSEPRHDIYSNHRTGRPRQYADDPPTRPQPSMPKLPWQDDGK
jgi:hypothetical protein